MKSTRSNAQKTGRIIRIIRYVYRTCDFRQNSDLPSVFLTFTSSQLYTIRLFRGLHFHHKCAEITGGDNFGGICSIAIEADALVTIILAHSYQNSLYIVDTYQTKYQCQGLHFFQRKILTHILRTIVPTPLIDVSSSTKRFSDI